MHIFNKAGKLILDVQVDDSSYRYRAIMGEHNLTLNFSLAEHVEIPVGAYCTFQGETYTLERPENLKLQHNRLFEYKVIMESVESKAKLLMFRNTVDNRIKFSLTAKPHEHLEMFVKNLQRYGDNSWSVGECIDSEEKLINYDCATCLDALGQMASEFDSEYEFNGKTVSLHKVEYNKNNPLQLSYGKGNGFVSGVTRENDGNNPPIESLYVQGGHRNIDPSKYKSKDLLLPKSKTIRYDGEKFEDEVGFNSIKAFNYITDKDGYCIRRVGKASITNSEGSLDCSDIYPKREGEVTSVVVVDEAKNFYDIIDTTIPDTLNYSDCLIDGETMTIIFQSGDLAGREFEVKYFHTASSNKAGKRFEIAPQEKDGEMMPSDTFNPKNGDKYAIFNIMLPQSYISDDTNKKGASWDMFRKAVKYLYDNEVEHFTFSGDIDQIWARKNWVTISPKIKLGSYVHFSDVNFQPDGILVRILDIKDYINTPYHIELTLSNARAKSGFYIDVINRNSRDLLFDRNLNQSLDFTKRRFSDSLLNTDKKINDYGKILQPNIIQATKLLFGDDTLQFRFIRSTTDKTEVADTVTWNNTNKKLLVASSVIQHLTYGITTLTPNYRGTYKIWSIAGFGSDALTNNADTTYYLYAKCSLLGDMGNFMLTTEKIEKTTDDSYIYLLVGVLNSEFNNDRVFVRLYGYAPVSPARVNPTSIVSEDGTTYLDLEKNEFSTSGKRRTIFVDRFLEGGTVETLDLTKGSYIKLNTESQNTVMVALPKKKDADVDNLNCILYNSSENYIDVFPANPRDEEVEKLYTLPPQGVAQCTNIDGKWVINSTSKDTELIERVEKLEKTTSYYKEYDLTINEQQPDITGGNIQYDERQNMYRMYGRVIIKVPKTADYFLTLNLLEEDYQGKIMVDGVNYPIQSNMTFKYKNVNEIVFYVDTDIWVRSIVVQEIIDIPTKVSDLENDLNFITNEELTQNQNKKLNVDGSNATIEGMNAQITALPEWVEEPNDNTFIIRQDIGGSNQYGRVKFSAFWSYIKKKANNLYSTINHSHDNFVKSGLDAKSGFVPAPPTTAGTLKYLREDGTWTEPPMNTGPKGDKGDKGEQGVQGEPGTNATTTATATETANGLMSAADKKKLNSIDKSKLLTDIGMNDVHITETKNDVVSDVIDRRLIPVSIYVPGTGSARTTAYPYGASIGDKWTYQHRMVVIFSFASKVNGQLSININSTGAKRVYLHGTTDFSDRYYIPSGASAMFVYDEPSSSFKMIDVIKNPYLDNSFIGTCSTASSTAAKVVTIAEFTSSYLVKGVKVVINFSNSNTASVSSVTLNVSGTGAKPIKIRKNNTITNLPAAGYLNVAYPVEFMYDGTNWIATNIEIDSTYNLSNYVTNATFNSFSNNIEASLKVFSNLEFDASPYIRTVRLNYAFTQSMLSDDKILLDLINHCVQSSHFRIITSNWSFSTTTLKYNIKDVIRSYFSKNILIYEDISAVTSNTEVTLIMDFYIAGDKTPMVILDVKPLTLT